MPPRVVGPPRKEACVIIIDVGKNMARGADEEKGSGLDHALHAVKLSECTLSGSGQCSGRRLGAESWGLLQSGLCGCMHRFQFSCSHWRE